MLCAFEADQYRNASFRLCAEMSVEEQCGATQPRRPDKLGGKVHKTFNARQRISSSWPAALYETKAEVVVPCSRLLPGILSALS